MNKKQPYASTKPGHLTWLNLDALDIESDWQHKAQALQTRRWRIIGHASKTW